MQTTVKSNAAIKRALDDPKVSKIKIENHDLFLKPSGDRKTATWYIGFYSKGLKQRAFGKYPNFSLNEAIQLRLSLIPKMLAEEPFVATRFKTMSELFDWFKLNMGKKEALRKKNILNIIDKHLKPSLGKLLISEFDRQHVYDLFRDKEDKYKTSTIKNMLSVLKQILSQATEIKLIENNVLVGTKITMFTENKIEAREGRLEWRHIPNTCKCISNCTYIPARIFNLVLLMLGTRLSETRKLSWDEVIFDDREIILISKNVKNKKKHVLPMSKKLYEILLWYKQWQRKRYQGNYVFNGTGKGYISKSTAEKYIRRVIPKGKKWSAHDYRKLLMDGVVRLRVDKFIAERILNHSQNALERAYPAKELSERVGEALEVWHQHLSNFYDFALHQEQKSKKKLNGDEALYIAA